MSSINSNSNNNNKMSTIGSSTTSTTTTNTNIVSSNEPSSSLSLVPSVSTGGADVVSSPSSSSSISNIVQSVQILIQNDPSLYQLYELMKMNQHKSKMMNKTKSSSSSSVSSSTATIDTTTTTTTTTDDDDDIVYPYASYLLSSSNTSNSSNTNNQQNDSQDQDHQFILYNIDCKLTIIQSMIQKLSRQQPEYIIQQLLVLHGYNNINNNNNTNQNSNTSIEKKEGNDDTITTNDTGTLTTTSTSNNTNTSSNNTTLHTLRDRTIRIEKNALQISTTINRIESIIQKKYTIIHHHTNILQHILYIQTIIKYIIRLQLELDKCHTIIALINTSTNTTNNTNNNTNSTSNIIYEDYMYDWPRDIIRSATCILQMEDLLITIDQLILLQQQQQNQVVDVNEDDKDETVLIPIQQQEKNPTTIGSSSTKNKNNNHQKIAIIEHIRPIVQSISHTVRNISQQKLHILLQQLQFQSTNNTYNTQNTHQQNQNYDIVYELGNIIQVYYSFNEIQHIIYHLLDHIHNNTIHITKQLVVTNTNTNTKQSSTSNNSNSNNKLKQQIVIDTYIQQIVTCLIQVKTIVRILFYKMGDTTTTNTNTTSNTTRQSYYRSLFPNYNNQNNINTKQYLESCIPKIYHPYISIVLHTYNNNIYHPLFIVSLFWLRYCHTLSNILSDAISNNNNNNNSTSSNTMSTTNTASTYIKIDTMISYYPSLHIAAYTILQPLLDGFNNNNSNISSSSNNNTSHNLNSLSLGLNRVDDMTNSYSSNNNLFYSSSGILGGVGAGLFNHSTFGSSNNNNSIFDNPQSGTTTNNMTGSSSSSSTTTTRNWTIPSNYQQQVSVISSSIGHTTTSSLTTSMTSSTTAITNSLEWKAYQGYNINNINNNRNNTSNTQNTGSMTMGLYPLQQAFVTACQDRLMVPLQYMFHENVSIGDDGVTMSTGIIILPSKYDIQRFDEHIRNELSIASNSTSTSTTTNDSGDMTMIVQLITQCVVSIVSEFCIRAKSAMSNVSHQLSNTDTISNTTNGYIHEKDWSMTESLKHDCKIVAILYTVKQYLQNAPERTYVTPYQGTTSDTMVLSQHMKAANICLETLASAFTTIDTTITNTILIPLCRTINRLLATNVLSKIHLGIYLVNKQHDTNDDDDTMQSSFIQKDIVPILDKITQVYCIKFPSIYANMMACNIISFIIYSYLSNVTLIRPLSETIRLHITQDLADLEMALEQFISNVNNITLQNKNFNTSNTKHTNNIITTLQQVDGGKPYGELRAVRQMLFWTGLDSKSKPADDLAKSLLNEIWVKDIRLSTIFHYLFSFGPNMLSSPYHVKRISATEYVKLLVPWEMIYSLVNHSNHRNNMSVNNNNKSIDAGEDIAYMTIMACCESYIQRASVVTGSHYNTADEPGDTRIAQMVITFGHELLRRRGRN